METNHCQGLTHGLFPKLEAKISPNIQGGGQSHQGTTYLLVNYDATATDEATAANEMAPRTPHSLAEAGFASFSSGRPHTSDEVSSGLSYRLMAARMVAEGMG